MNSKNGFFFTKEKLDAAFEDSYRDWLTTYTPSICKIREKQKVYSLLDIGANLGATIKFLCEQFPDVKTVFGIEPVTENFDYMKRVVAEIPSISSTLINSAIYYGCNTMGLCGMADENVGGIHLKSTVDDFNFDKRYGESFLLDREVPCNTLEQLFGGETIDVCKMDIEGSEWNVIENSSFLKNNVLNILIECHMKSDQEVRAFFRTHLPDFSVVDFYARSHGYWLTKG